MPNAQGTTKGSRSVADLRHDECGRILNTTLNPTIIFPSVVSANLFANLDTYSQVAGCTPDKIVSQCARLSRLNLTMAFLIGAFLCGTLLALSQMNPA
jgi:hypothetical protein